MSSAALKVLALMALVIAVVLGFTAYRMSQNLTKPAVAATADSATPAPTLAVVTVKPLTAYAAVPADAVVLVPVAVLPEEYFRQTDEVVGKAPLSDVPVGTTLGPRYFREANTLVRSIPPGFQAMSLEINDVIAVGGFVRPGDLVDVLLYIRSTGREVEDSQARILLYQVRVLAYEERVLNDAEPSDGDANSKSTQQQRGRRIRTAVLAVAEADTTRVMLGASLGELRLALRGAQPVDGAVPSDIQPAAMTTDTTSLPPEAQQVITLRELAAVKKQKQSRPGVNAPAGDAPPPVVIYRGSDVQRVSR